MLRKGSCSIFLKTLIQHLPLIVNRNRPIKIFKNRQKFGLSSLFRFWSLFSNIVRTPKNVDIYSALFTLSLSRGRPMSQPYLEYGHYNNDYMNTKT